MYFTAGMIFGTTLAVTEITPLPPIGTNSQPRIISTTIISDPCNVFTHLFSLCCANDFKFNSTYGLLGVCFVLYFEYGKLTDYPKLIIIVFNKSTIVYIILTNKLINPL